MASKAVRKSLRTKKMLMIVIVMVTNKKLQNQP